MTIKTLLILCIYFSITPALILTAQNWRIIEKQPMPMKISNNALVEAKMGGKTYVYSFGGIDSTKLFSGITNKSFRYDVELDVWDTIPPLPDSNTKIATAASYVNGIIYIIGGYSVFPDGSEISSDKVHRFDPATNSYLSDAAPILVPIDDHVQAVYRDSLIYVVTGWSNTFNVINVQIYNVLNNSWSFGTSVPSNSYQVFGSTGVIIGDTIYYYGGARNGQFFPSSNQLRKGAIDPSDPNKILWQTAIIDANTFAYRPAGTSINGNPIWVGGSSVSYNFDGIAYNGSGGVSPANRSISYDISTGLVSTSTPDSGFFPMDLRGIASISNSVKYIAGGMINDQEVSNKTYRLEYINVTGINTNTEKRSTLLNYPNPFRAELKIRNNSTQNVKYRIIDIKGKVLVISSIHPDKESIIKTDSWKNGIYLLCVDHSNNIEVTQLLKIK